jgi:hypothetical protein
VHVQVNGLAAGRSYFYRFMQGDATSTTGRCCTAPAPGATVQRLRLAFASCQRWEHGHYAAWRSVVQDQPDLVLFLGDYIYEYAQPAKTEGLARPQPLRTARTLQDYRDRYALHKSDPLLQAAHAQCNWSVIWDDHEVENDYAADQGLGEATAFLARRMAAWQRSMKTCRCAPGTAAQHAGAAAVPQSALGIAGPVPSAGWPPVPQPASLPHTGQGRQRQRARGPLPGLFAPPAAFWAGSRKPGWAASCRPTAATARKPRGGAWLPRPPCSPPAAGPAAPSPPTAGTATRQPASA